MKKIRCILLFITLVFFSCKKFIDIQPKGYSIPKTVEDFNRLLNGQRLTSPLSTELDVMTDDFFSHLLDTTATAFASYETNAYVWRPEIYTNANDITDNSPWSQLYKNAFTYNAIIENIDNATLGTEFEKKSIKSQAYFGRAVTFWYLVNIYSKQYNAATAKTDLGIPLITSTDINTPLPSRGTVDGTYEFILNDIHKALKGLPVSSATKYRGTKAAGYALLARIYLHQRKYKESIEAVNQALNLHAHLVDYNTKVKSLGNGSFEAIEDKFFEDNNSEVIYNEHFGYVNGLFNRDISTEINQLLTLDDTRRFTLVKRSSRDDKTYQWRIYIRVCIGITTPELYLIRAEANAREGNLTAALDDLNELRKNRLVPASFQPFISTDRKEVIQKILTEKRLEFYFRGKRWFEFRRLSVDPEFSFTIYHYFPDSSKIALPPTSNRLVLRIPNIALADNIQQNP